MRYDTINLLQGADIQNLVVASGTSFPSLPDLGELFFRTDQDKLYVYKSGGWAESGSSAAAFNPASDQTISGIWSFTQPVTGATPMQAAQLTTKGYVDAVVATKGTGTVTSVGLTSSNSAITVSGSPITSSGTLSITANNFTASVAGVVPASGGGTTNFLRADGTWSEPSATSTSLTGTGAVTFNPAVMGTYAGVESGLVPLLGMSCSTRAANERAWGWIVDQTNGNLVLRPYSDALVAGANSISLSRSANTTTNISLTATTITLNGAVTSTSFSGSGSGLTNLNASNLTTGTVDIARIGTSGTANSTTFLRGDGTWAAPTVTALNGTGAFLGTVATTGVYAGAAGANYPMVRLVASGLGTDNKAINVYTNSTDGSFNVSFSDDSLLSQTAFFTVNRSGKTATQATLTSNAITLAGPTSAQNVNVTGSTAPANGIYLSAANTLNFATNSASRLAISSTGSVDFGSRYTELNTASTAAASTTIDCSVGNVFTVTMSANITSLTFTNIPASGRAYSLTLILQQDSSGGRSVTWPSSVKWAGGTAPTLSGANKTDIVNMVTTTGGSTWYAVVSGLNF